MKIPQNITEYFIGLLVVIGLRFLPHPPNVEPIMATMMPFSKRFGWVSGLVFSLLAVLIFDVLTGTLGVWSLVTASTYALLGALAGLYLKNSENRVARYVAFAIIGTLIYDAITGIGMGVLLFNQSFMVTLVGQIPFTMNHLAGNIILSAIISPLLYKWVVENPKLETNKIAEKFALEVK